MELKRRFKLSLNRGFALGFLISFSALIHIPSTFQKGVFDRNAAPQFIFLMIVGVCSGLIFTLNKRETFGFFTFWVGILLISFSTVSLVLSESWMTSFLGDTGRYAGYASLIALIFIALAASTLSDREMIDFLIALAMGIVMVTLLGLLQSFEIIDLPTGAGAGSSLGNLDFLSAWCGTTFLLIYLINRELKGKRIFFSIYLVIAFVVLWRIEAKQGFFVLIFTSIGLLGFKLLSRKNLSSISKLAWKAIATFFILIWSEIVYLVPMLKLPIPGIGDDPQVAIRADFWFAASRMFAHNLGFGVGPDNYGNFYEKFRSLNSVQNAESVLANDAHSSLTQSFATLGLFATLSLLILILLVAYAAIDLFFENREVKFLLVLLAFLSFYTNSLISPITLPHKAIFWALGGYLLGEQARRGLTRTIGISIFRFRTISILLFIPLFAALYIFTPAILKFNSAITHANRGHLTSYETSNALPCVAYAGAQMNLVSRVGGDVIEAAYSITRNHPRCLDSLSVLAQEALSQKNYTLARGYIFQLLDVAPARQSVVRLAAIYAMEANDQELKEILTSQGIKLGILSEDLLK